MPDFREQLRKVEGTNRNEIFFITPELSISIQASESHYCTPRENLRNNLFFSEFELGFPNFNPPEYIAEYADSDHLQESIYCHVPYELIQRMINELSPS